MKPKVISGTIDKSRVFVVDFVSVAIISTQDSLVLDIYPDLIKGLFNFITLWKSEMKLKSFINYKSTHI